MPNDDLPIAVIGEGPDLLVAATAVEDCGRTPLIVLADQRSEIAFCLIRGSWMDKELPIKYKCGDEIDTTDTWASMLNGFYTRTQAYLLVQDMRTAIATSSMMMAGGNLAGVIFAGSLAETCVRPDEHQFACVPYWQTEARVKEPVEDAVLFENSDFSEFPWAYCYTFANHIVKIYPGEKPPIKDVRQVVIPVETNCDCLSRMDSIFRVGPIARWDFRNHQRKSIYNQTKVYVNGLPNRLF